MKRNFARRYLFILCSIFVIVIIYLLNKLPQFNNNNNIVSVKVLSIHDELYARVAKAKWNCTRGNISPAYCVAANIWTGERFRARRPFLAVTTHLTVDHLPRLRRLLTTWSGLVSATVFLPDRRSTAEVVCNVAAWLQRYPSEGRRLRVHLVAASVGGGGAMSALRMRPCSNTTTTTTAHGGVGKNYENMVYPNNRLRNAAIRYAGSRYVLPVDVDVEIARRPDHSYVESFLRRREKDSDDSTGSVVYVLPAFEKRTDTPTPADKRELRLYLSMNNVRSFSYCSRGVRLLLRLVLLDVIYFLNLI